jgi:lipoate-protein ligase A
LWDDDVINAARWVGEAWSTALEALGARDLSVHTSRAERRPWSTWVCFAALGPGEVTAGSAKVVGIAQRRTRVGARWHSTIPLSWDPGPLVALLDLDDEIARRAADELRSVALGLRDIVSRPLRALDGDDLVERVEDALVAALP